MEYHPISEGRYTPGLRLVLTAHVPGPWGMAARSLFHYKNLEYLPLLQEPGGENSELQEWTGQASAPVAVYNNEAPCITTESIIFLAERLNPDKPLIPEDFRQRMEMFGIIREIAGIKGFGWSRRASMFHMNMQLAELAQSDMMQRMVHRYNYSADAAATAVEDGAKILSQLEEHLKQQQKKGSDWFIGKDFTAADIYWTHFSMLLNPPPKKLIL